MQANLQKKATEELIECIKKVRTTLKNSYGNGSERVKKIVDKLIAKLESFLEDPNSEKYLSLINTAIDIIIKLRLILSSLDK